LLAVMALFASTARASEAMPDEVPSDSGILQQSWKEAQASELAGFEHDRDRRKEAVAHFRRASQLFESIAHQRSDPAGISEAYWRSARSHWLVADTLPREAKNEREGLYLHARALTDKGIEVNPECGECMLWKFSSIGRLATSRGVWSSARQASVMADLLDRGIALQPTHADNEHNSALGNLHYSSAIFYRVVPDWFFMSWMFGVRGDKERSLQHIHTALALHPDRLEYQVELGAQLVCLGITKDEATRIDRGKAVLLDALQRQAGSLDDERELEAAQIMLDQPKKACGYSGDTWIEIDRKKAERMVNQ